MTPHDCPTCKASRALKTLSASIDAMIEQGAEWEMEAAHAADVIKEHHADFVRIKGILDQSLREGVVEYGPALRQIDAIVRGGDDAEG